MNRIRGVLAALVAAGLVTTVAVTVIADHDDRGRRSFRARLNGFEEVPTLSSPGSGSLRLRLSSDGQSATYTLTFSGLSNAFAAHIHLGADATVGGVIAFLCGGGGKPACPASSGSVSGTLVPADVIGPANQGIAPGQWTEFVAALRAGFTYVNVHTNDGVDPPNTGPGDFPTGEIRGQITRADD
jgi:hypothetical protein